MQLLSSSDGWRRKRLCNDGYIDSKTELKWNEILREMNFNVLFFNHWHLSEPLVLLRKILITWPILGDEKKLLNGNQIQWLIFWKVQKRSQFRISILEEFKHSGWGKEEKFFCNPKRQQNSFIWILFITHSLLFNSLSKVSRSIWAKMARSHSTLLPNLHECILFNRHHSNSSMCWRDNFLFHLFWNKH